MRRLLTGIAGGVGLAALWRFLARKPAAEQPTVDPAEELRHKLAEARETVDDRDEFDAAEGTPVDQVGERRSLDEPPPLAEPPPLDQPPTLAEPPPLDQPQPGEEPRSLEERRRAVHEQAQEALGRMQQQNGDD
jgi:hypothetical protein